MNLIAFLYYKLPPLLWMAFLFPTNGALTTGSTSHVMMPILKWLFPHAGPETIHMLHIAFRKTVHFFNYALLMFLWYRAFRAKDKGMRTEQILYACAIAVGYAALDEYVQCFIPSRTGSVGDWLIDSAGVACMVGIILVRNTKQGLRIKG